MRAGRIVEAGTRDEVLDNPRQPYTQALIRAVPPFDRRVDRFEGLAGEAGAEPVKTAGTPPVWFARARPERSAPVPLLEVEALSVTFPSRPSLFGPAPEPIQAVKSVSFTISVGETLGLVGESGSGKSTVARTIAGLGAPGSGTVRFRGHDIGALSTTPALRARCLDMQMIFQDPFSSLNPRKTVWAALAKPMRVNGFGEPAPRSRAPRCQTSESSQEPVRSQSDINSHNLDYGTRTRFPSMKINSLGRNSEERLTLTRLTSTQPIGRRIIPSVPERRYLDATYLI